LACLPLGQNLGGFKPSESRWFLGLIFEGIDLKLSRSRWFVDWNWSTLRKSDDKISIYWCRHFKRRLGLRLLPQVLARAFNLAEQINGSHSLYICWIPQLTSPSLRIYWASSRHLIQILTRPSTSIFDNTESWHD
jgi:hypothetical protein